ncbi:unnamed protein product [Amoebophrya sp. A25]|nr:unnamed protein product [Amoebophrya sp. A25]|eukprot:GSA25T00024866001.1
MFLKEVYLSVTRKRFNLMETVSVDIIEITYNFLCIVEVDQLMIALWTDLKLRNDILFLILLIQDYFTKVLLDLLRKKQYSQRMKKLGYAFQGKDLRSISLALYFCFSLLFC